MVARKKWSELSKRNRRVFTVVAVVEVVLLAATLFDLRRRPAAQVRGPKWMWRSLAFVNIVGPVAYFVVGRRREAGS
jgi:hypothetical protein